ncbi:MAG: type IX secretion system membrane protein PorP/SprF [Bacteroidetes bacterium]|nr:type IX secretion system membrane protein PorP/SprF [Bacteroidota bacterium]
MKHLLKYFSSVRIFILLFYLSYVICHLSFSQQMPYYTQFKPNNIMLNPAVAGTKRIMDARLFYRNQWTGFDDAPVTMGFSANSRFMNGSMGAGIAYFSDKTGPTSRNDFALAYSYHAKFDDVELSLGAAGHLLSYLVDGSKLHMHIPFDNAIDLAAFQKKKVWDASAGALFYNDRFHVGVSVLNFMEPTINYYPNDDTLHKTKIHMVPHVYGSVGYNWSGQEDWIWENSLQAVYSAFNPIVVDYNLRLHYKQVIFGGLSIRLRDAIALNAGVTIAGEFHISYSYDFIVSPLSAYQSGSHEIMLAWSSNLGLDKQKKYDTSRFKRQRYGYMF